MAEVLGIACGLAIGWMIGWRWCHRREARAVADAAIDQLRAEWAEHVKVHAQAQAASVVLTAPEAYVPLPDGRKISVSVH